MQSYEAEYRPEASADILKWKPASHNSVDFTLLPVEHDAVMADPRCLDAADARNQLYFLGVYSRREVVVAYDVKAGAGGVLQPTETPARVEFDNAQEDPAQYVGMVIECTYDAKTGVWHFMRERSKCGPALPPNAACMPRLSTAGAGARVQGQGHAQRAGNVPQGHDLHLFRH